MTQQAAHDKPPRATLQQKVQILDYFHAHKCSQVGAVEQFKDVVAISKSTINEWLKNEHEFRSRLQAASASGGRSKRRVKFKYDQINSKMDELVEKNPAMTEPELRVYWRKYAREYGVDDPKRLEGFSHGWLDQFKKRHNLKRERGKGGEMGIGKGGEMGIGKIGKIGGIEKIGKIGKIGEIQEIQKIQKIQKIQEIQEIQGETPDLNQLKQNQMLNVLKRRRYGPQEGLRRRSGRRTKEFQPQKSLSFTPLVEPYDDRGGLRIKSLLSRENSRSDLRNDPKGTTPYDLKGTTPYDLKGTTPYDLKGTTPYDLKGTTPYDLKGTTGTQSLKPQSLNGSHDFKANIPEIQDNRSFRKDPNPVGSEVLMEPIVGATASAHEIERFFFFRANEFFQRNKYDYPQTIKLYEEFKTSFLSEKLISLRAEDPGIPVPGGPNGGSAEKADYGSDIVPEFIPKQKPVGIKALRPDRKLAPKTLWEQNKNTFS